jgi:hypothetical protein
LRRLPPQVPTRSFFFDDLAAQCFVHHVLPFLTRRDKLALAVSRVSHGWYQWTKHELRSDALRMTLLVQRVRNTPIQMRWDFHSITHGPSLCYATQLTDTYVPWFRCTVEYSVSANLRDGMGECMIVGSNLVNTDKYTIHDFCRGEITRDTFSSVSYANLLVILRVSLCDLTLLWLSPVDAAYWIALVALQTDVQRVIWRKLMTWYAHIGRTAAYTTIAELHALDFGAWRKVMHHHFTISSA